MKTNAFTLIRGAHNVQAQHRGGVVTIGNFDGVHRGHQAIIESLVAEARSLHTAPLLITFEPHPLEFFRHADAPARLTRLREKLNILQTTALKQVLCLPFNRQLAHMSAQDFIRDILVEKLAIRRLLVGKDFRFGFQRKGDLNLLTAAGHEFGFDVQTFPTFLHEGQRISSSLVRSLLQAGELAQAKILLGRDYSMCGRVMHGDKRGRLLGIPTANLYLHRLVTPLTGVFAVQVKGIGSQVLNGMANLGTRPTVCGMKTLLEVHLFDFNADIYGQYIEVIFREKLRPEQRFASISDLKDQLERDAVMARGVLG